jgi:hypothetical protein
MTSFLVGHATTVRLHSCLLEVILRLCAAGGIGQDQSLSNGDVKRRLEHLWNVQRLHLIFARVIKALALLAGSEEHLPYSAQPTHWPFD